MDALSRAMMGRVILIGRAGQLSREEILEATTHHQAIDWQQVIQSSPNRFRADQWNLVSQHITTSGSTLELATFLDKAVTTISLV